MSVTPLEPHPLSFSVYCAFQIGSYTDFVWANLELWSSHLPSQIAGTTGCHHHTQLIFDIESWPSLSLGYNPPVSASKCKHNYFILCICEYSTTWSFTICADLCLCLIFLLGINIFFICRPALISLVWRALKMCFKEDFYSLWSFSCGISYTLQTAQVQIPLQHSKTYIVFTADI